MYVVGRVTAAGQAYWKALKALKTWLEVRHIAYFTGTLGIVIFISFPWGALRVGQLGLECSL